MLFPRSVLLLTVPGTENSESDADRDAQEQLWDDKKVFMGAERGHGFVERIPADVLFLLRMTDRSQTHVTSQELSELNCSVESFKVTQSTIEQIDIKDFLEY